MKPAIKDAKNPAFRSTYADLSAVIDAMREPYTSNGLTVWQDVELTETGVAVTTRLAHTSGQWIEFGPLTVPLSKRDAHGVGSATTYAKRYALCAALGIATEEDDGNQAATVKDDGYLDFVASLEAVADGGTARLLTAIKSEDTPSEWRSRLRAETRTWNALKARAEKADKSLVPV